jgi:hypothetical protein
MSGAPGNLFRVRLLLAAKDRGGDEESHSKTSRLRGLSGCRSARLLIGEDAEPGGESDRVIHKHYVPEDSLLANIDQMSTVHLFDGKSACFSKRTELMDLLKCTKQTSTSLQVTKVKRCCQLIRRAALCGDALQKRCTVRGGAHRWCGYNVDRNCICPDRCNRSGHEHRGNWRLGSRGWELQDFCHSWVPLRTSSVVYCLGEVGGLNETAVSS